jgi:hypothetical protein
MPGPIDQQLSPDAQESASIAVTDSKPMFFYPSLAQSQREFQFVETEEACDGLDAYGGCVGISREYTWVSNYWAFYRSAVRRVGSTLQCGWITVEYGCNWTYRKEKEFLGVGIGGASGAGGTWPYQNETLNLVSTPAITANAARYD